MLDDDDDDVAFCSIDERPTCIDHLVALVTPLDQSFFYSLSCFSVCFALAFATRPKAQEVKLYTSRLVHHRGDSTAVEVEDVPGVRRWDMARDSAAMVQLMKPF